MSLSLRLIYDRARQQFPHQRIIAQAPDGLHRLTYAQWADRTAQLAHGLAALGLQPGARVATLAWNHHRHLELYFAAALMGATYHTLNPRLPAAQLRYILGHARDQILLVDADLLPLVEPLLPALPDLRTVVLMGGAPHDSYHDYERLIADQPTTYPWPTLDESAPAGICYTSGTTGDPKGVAFSHRGLYLHAMMLCMADHFAIRARDVLMPIVPMFHVNAWGFPFAALMAGAGLVLPGKFTPQSLAQLAESERVTIAPGVPTVWAAFLPLLQSGAYDLAALKQIPCGGAAVSAALAQAYEERGIRIAHAYGLTEGGPVTHICTLTAAEEALPVAERAERLTRQGRPAPGIEQRLVGPTGADLPWDGVSPGELWIRGPWVAERYLDDPRTAESFVDGWYRTGDVATIEPDGTMRIVDRLKDLVKSGGEWISSVALENALLGAPGVAEAAVIATPHPRWEERPLALVVRRPGDPTPDEGALQAYLRERFPSFWVPDQIRFVESIPKGPTGKIDKRLLRTTWISA
ncbi:MAG TPA: long-chain-fatty-acid--CoA ligase [Symbiobacteriaceae bacterium]|nr:long-chain-fatty-acid--CoA ligase [Symbiobacteriaceae bacterium]